MYADPDAGSQCAYPYTNGNGYADRDTSSAGFRYRNSAISSRDRRHANQHACCE
jgi:hypothetical protein